MTLSRPVTWRAVGPGKAGRVALSFRRFQAGAVNLGVRVRVSLSARRGRAGPGRAREFADSVTVTSAGWTPGPWQGACRVNDYKLGESSPADGTRPVIPARDHVLVFTG